MNIVRKKKFSITQMDAIKSAYQIFDIFQHEQGVFFLDSSQTREGQGRYSFIGFNPFDVYAASDIVSLNVLRQSYKTFQCLEQIKETPLPAGLVGFISYDYGVKQEKLKSRPKKDFIVPDVYFGFYEAIITFDHVLQKIYITAIDVLGEDNDANTSRAYNKIAYIYNKIKNNSFLSLEDKKKINDWMLVSSFDKDGYCVAVRKALEYIKKGDIYQVNLSQRFALAWDENHPSPVEIYKVLRELSPSFFSAYFAGQHFQILSSSPERFLQSDGKGVQTRPMKGTRRRGKTQEEDEELERALWESEKDKAELLMITDLLRNDLGRVCQYGSVIVKEARMMEKYATVFQTTALIEGVLKKGSDVFDLLEACSPCGSITGCPKIRSMEIIDELEPTRRSIYTGTLGYISFTGIIDFNVLIRTILMLPDQLVFQVGGGIVADSDPEKEYEETLVKAEGINQTLKKVLSGVSDER